MTREEAKAYFQSFACDHSSIEENDYDSDRYRAYHELGISEEEEEAWSQEYEDNMLAELKQGYSDEKMMNVLLWLNGRLNSLERAKELFALIKEFYKQMDDINTNIAFEIICGISKKTDHNGLLSRIFHAEGKDSELLPEMIFLEYRLLDRLRKFEIPLDFQLEYFMGTLALFRLENDSRTEELSKEARENVFEYYEKMYQPGGHYHSNNYKMSTMRAKPDIDIKKGREILRALANEDDISIKEELKKTKLRFTDK